MRLLRGLGGDVRFGARLLRKNPGFTAVALATLALGIGANTAIFSMVHAMLLQPLPYDRPDSLHRIHVDWHAHGVLGGSVSVPELDDLRREARAFEQVEAYVFRSRNVTGSGQPQRAVAIAMTAGLPELLGVAPATGRSFTPGEDRPGGAALVLVADGFWRERLGADPDIGGSVLRLDGVPHTIIGVMPAGFRFPGAGRDVQLFVPLALEAPAEADRGNHYLNVLARTRPDVSTQHAREELRQISTALEQRHGEYRGHGFTFAALPLRDTLVRESRAALLVLMSAVGLVLLIACANVANLLLARAAGRQREVSIRFALGADRWSLVRQMLVESLLLSALGGAAGLLLANWGVEAVRAAIPGGSTVGDVGLNAPVLSFALASCAITGLLFGIVPALHTSRQGSPAGLMQGTRATAGRRGRRLAGALVVGEMALALVLLVSAGLTIRSFGRLVQVDPGFDPRGLWTMGLSLPKADYPRPADAAGFARRLLERLAGLPGAAAAIVSELPLGGSYTSSGFTVEDALDDPSRAELMMDRQAVSPGYFHAMNIPILRGREFDERDSADSPGVVIIDESMARRFWPGGDPVGRRIKMATSDSDVPWLTIVGVVRHVRQYGPTVDGREQAYLPFVQSPSHFLSVVVRAADPRAFTVGAVQEEVRALDPALPLFAVRPMEDLLSGVVRGQRFSMGLLMLFAAVAMLLSAVGIYGVTACAVSQRRREIGVRMALGARGSDVQWMMLRQGMRLAGMGLLIGLAGAAAAGRLMSSLLYGVSPLDPITYAAVSAGLLGVAAAAVYLPARRATHVSPREALHCD